MYYFPCINQDDLNLKKMLESIFSETISKTELNELKNTQFSIDTVLNIIQRMYIRQIEEITIKVKYIYTMLPEPIYIIKIDKNFIHCFSVPFICKILSTNYLYTVEPVRKPVRLVYRDEVLQLDSQTVYSADINPYTTIISDIYIIDLLLRCLLIIDHASYHFKYLQQTNYSNLDYSHLDIEYSKEPYIFKILSTSPHSEYENFIKGSDIYS